jgi:single-strand DNA-binding protein
LLFGRAATGVGPYLKKGTQVGVQAEAQFETWEKDGQRHSKVKFSVRNIQILNKPGQKAEPEQSTFDDDVPF